MIGDICICPLVEFVAVECYTLLTDWKLPHIRPDDFVENVATHAEIARRLFGSEYAGLKGGFIHDRTLCVEGARDLYRTLQRAPVWAGVVEGAPI